jgi:hypothetical protein
MNAATACSECRAPLPAPKRCGPARVVCSAECRKARGFRLAREHWQAEKAASPDGVARRVCSSCGEKKEVRRPTWPFSNDAPIGTVCFLCFRRRKKTEYDPAYRAEKKELGPSLRSRVYAAANLAKAAAAAVKQSQQSGALELDADALERGAEAVNATAESVMTEVGIHAEDPESPFHKEALQMLADRILPMATYNELAVQMAREGEFGNVGRRGKAPSRPRYTVNVRATAGPTEDAE